MIKNLGIPYMGSKRKLANEIVDFIANENRNACYFYDLFGGGGAVSFTALQHPQFKRVVYNELNTGVVNLLRKIQKDGITKEFYQWIDRETFHKHKDDGNWFAGFVKTCWSFSNNQKTYMFSKENERLKKPLHYACITGDSKYLNDFEDIIGLKIPTECLSYTDIHKRRLAIKAYIKKNGKRIDLDQLQQLERLQQLQQLWQLERLQQLWQLEIQNKSYEKVIIDTPPEQTVIYIDPPYENTEKYQCDINHSDLWNWVKKSPYTIYISSYNAPFELVHQMKHRSSLSATNNAKKTTENLYCNKGWITQKNYSLF